MDRIKSIFISAATMYWLAVFIGALVEGFYSNEWHYGLLISAVVPVLFLARLFIFKTPRTSRNPLVVLLLVFVGFSLELFYFIDAEGIPDAMLLSGFSLVLWLIYIFWYSVFPNRKSDALEIGKKLTQLSFIDQNGAIVSTDRFIGKKVIYLFYRGNWCPLCMAQIGEISEQYREINELGAEVLLISPQPHKFTVSLARKMDVPFWFLTDVDGLVAKQLGIYVKGGTPLGMEILGFESDTVLPTVVITDETGEIIYTDQTDNYRVRPEPETFLAVLKNST
jgi:peroxiredoxin